MNRHRARAQIVLTTAICFASLATFAVDTPAQSQASACNDPSWVPSWISWWDRGCD